MNKVSFNIEFLLDWESLTSEKKDQIVELLSSEVWLKYKDDITAKADEEWNEMDEEAKKKFDYKSILQAHHTDMTAQIASNLKDYVEMEVRAWTK